MNMCKSNAPKEMFSSIKGVPLNFHIVTILSVKRSTNAESFLEFEEGHCNDVRILTETPTA